MAWTLPLQLLHFGSAPLYALLANLLAAPLLAPMTLSAMGLALASLLLPAAALPLLAWPVAQLAALLIALVSWISHWPAARLLTGHPQPWVVALLVLGLLPWLLTGWGRWRPMGQLLLTLLAVVVQGVAFSWRMVWWRFSEAGSTGCWPVIRAVAHSSAPQLMPAVAGWPAAWRMSMAINGWTG